MLHFGDRGFTNSSKKKPAASSAPEPSRQFRDGPIPCKSPPKVAIYTYTLYTEKTNTAGYKRLEGGGREKGKPVEATKEKGKQAPRDFGPEFII